MAYANETQDIVATNSMLMSGGDVDVKSGAYHQIKRYQAHLVVCVYAKDVASIRAVFRATYAAQLIDSLRQPSYFPVHVAVLTDDREVLRTLVDGLEPESLNVFDDDGRTPLMLAATRNQAADIHILVQAGASVDLVDRDGCNALVLAAMSGKTDAMRVLLAVSQYDETSSKNNLVDKQDSKGNTALMHAVVGGHYDAVDVLLQHGASPTLANTAGERPLCVAISRGLHRIVRALCTSASLDINAVDHMGMTGLMYAAQYATETYDSSILNLLLKRNARMDVRDSSGDTVLLREAKSGSDFSIEYLLSSGACLDEVDAEGCNALTLAAKNNNLTALKYLLSRSDINIDSHDYKGNTPLFYAVAAGYHAIAYELLQRGATINMPFGLSLLSMAKLLDKSDMVGLLLMYGANDVNELSVASEYSL